MEYELLDTGVFDGNRYFDVYVEVAKAGPDDILIRLASHQPRARPGRAAPLAAFVVPGQELADKDAPLPELQPVAPQRAAGNRAVHPELGEYTLYCQRTRPLLFTDNDTNLQRLFGQPNSELLTSKMPFTTM